MHQNLPGIAHKAGRGESSLPWCQPLGAPLIPFSVKGPQAPLEHVTVPGSCDTGPWCGEMGDEDHGRFSSLCQALVPLSLSTTGNGFPLQPTPLAPSPQVQASCRGWAPSQSQGFKQHPSPAGGSVVTCRPMAGSWGSRSAPCGLWAPRDAAEHLSSPHSPFASFLS